MDGWMDGWMMLIFIALLRPATTPNNMITVCVKRMVVSYDILRRAAGRVGRHFLSRTAQQNIGHAWPPMEI
jgi:hypothetical protein